MEGSFFCTNGTTTTCIFRMWFAWQTPWKTSGMQTGGTRCLSATFACVLLINGYVCGFFTWFSNILCEYETGDWNCTTRVCSVIWGSLVGVPSNKAAFTSQMYLRCFIFHSRFQQKTFHLTNMFEAFPTGIPLMETSATVSSPSQSSSIFAASSWELESWNWPV